MLLLGVSRSTGLSYVFCVKKDSFFGGDAVAMVCVSDG